ncbi:MAG: hypothetical protein PWR01_4560 [Clostridiales bacterium]|jgi:hypothetical protein|nr:hypothetical protein [Clostridiales bacterium]MDN5283487.1 hypothetical protein [Candidatus Ozemobacter sp.]
MMLLKRQFKTRLLCVIFIALGALSGIAQEGKDLQSARKELLQETFRLLDKLELDNPRSQADIVKVRERILGIYRTPIYVKTAGQTEPQVSYARRSRSRNSEWQQFYDSVKSLSNDNLVKKLREKLQRQKALEYRDSRRHIMLEVDNYGNYIECIYTGKIVKADKMPKSSVLNIEHSWPQSKGAKGIAKADLHHLFPTDPIANSTRGSLPFGPVSHPSWAEGGSECDGDTFEPRKKYRGNVARALFYFSVRYDKKIGRDEEEALRKWCSEDPVDANEKARNDRVERIQGNRNPFIDHPEFVDRITDF